MPYKEKKRNVIIIICEWSLVFSLLIIGLLNIITLPVILVKIFGWIASINILLTLLSELVAIVIIRPSKIKKKSLKKVVEKLKEYG